MVANTVFVVTHSHELTDGCEDIKILGIFSTQITAEATIQHLLTKPGFKDFPDGFHIEPYPLDIDFWTSGFVTVTY